MPERERSKRLASSLLVCAWFAAAISIATSVVNAQQRFRASSSAVHAHGFAMPTNVFYPHGVVRTPPLSNRAGHFASRHATDLPFRDRRHRRRRVFQCTGLNLQQLIAPYPGYGFDFEHLNAINSDLAIKAAIDPATQLQLQDLEQLGCTEVPTFDYFLGDGDYIVPDETAEESEQPAQSVAQPEIVIVQEQPPSQTPAQASTAAQPEAAPGLDEGQFELVLANGKQLEAVAFTRDGDEIIYITPEGSRQTIAVSELDIAATVRVNEALGTPIQLSF